MKPMKAAVPAAPDFEPHYLETPAGRLHYVDEGAGRPLVLVHGTPTWSYVFRHIIQGLADRYRVVAIDHLGFGRSDKPLDADYRPAAHARRLASLVDHLGLDGYAIGVHDFGGPIGLSGAIDRPERVSGVVLFNTWMWSLAGTSAARAARILGGPVGRLLYTRLNFSARVLLPAGFGDRRRLTREIHRRYLEPFASPDQRVAPWVFARELLGSSEWYQSLWERRGRIVDKPALLLWGMKDPFFGEEALARWSETLGRAHVVRIPEAGHFVPEEAPELALRELDHFLAGL